MPACGRLLDLPGPVPENIVSCLNPATRKVFRLTCKEARQLVDDTVQSAIVDVGNVRVLCGPWRPLHITFPQLRHLTLCLRSTGTITWDTPQSAVAATSVQVSGRNPDGPGGAAASFSLRLLRDSVPRLRHLQSLDLTQCHIDPTVWSALCDGVRGLPRGLALCLHPAAALLFSGRTWGERLSVMMSQLVAWNPDIRVRVMACAGSGGSGRGSGGAACWCDVDGEAGLRKLAELPYIYELPVCVWSRAPCQPDWLLPLSSLTRLRRLHISCCNAADPWDHAWLAGLSALVSLRELDLGRTDSPLTLADLAPLSACSALTALSVGSLTAAPSVAGPFQAGLPLIPLQPQPEGVGVEGDGAAAAAAAAAAGVSPLPQIRFLEIRCCLAVGSLPLGELVPGAVSISMCALTVGGSGNGNGINGHSVRVVSGHVFESLLSPAVTLGVAMALPPAAQLLMRFLSPPRLGSQFRSQLQQSRQHRPAAELLPTLLPPLRAAAQLHYGLRFLELVQQEAAVITFGRVLGGTGRSPLPDTAMLGCLTGLEHLQFSGWGKPGGQLPALLAAAQRLPRLRRLTFRDCDAQCFGWRASRMMAHLALGVGLGLRPLEALGALQLTSIEAVEVLGAPSLRLLEQLALACHTPQLRCLELHHVRHWDERAFQRILGTASRAAAAAAAAAVKASTAPRAAPTLIAAGGVVGVGGIGCDGGGGGGGGDGGGGSLPRLRRSFMARAAEAAAHAAAAAGAAGCRPCDGSGVILPREVRRLPAGWEPGTQARAPPRTSGSETWTCESADRRGAAVWRSVGAPEAPAGNAIAGGGVTRFSTRGCREVEGNCRWRRLSHIVVH
ncbi:hypothetical protein VaNZ11_001241, partial [Volvox africanus]